MIFTIKNNNLAHPTTVRRRSDDGPTTALTKTVHQPQREILIRYVPVFSLLTRSVTFTLLSH